MAVGKKRRYIMRELYFWWGVGGYKKPPPLLAYAHAGFIFIKSLFCLRYSRPLFERKVHGVFTPCEGPSVLIDG
jgi:hypothetical protein